MRIPARGNCSGRDLQTHCQCVALWLKLDSIQQILCPLHGSGSGVSGPLLIPDTKPAVSSRFLLQWLLWMRTLRQQRRRRCQLARRHRPRHRHWRCSMPSTRQRGPRAAAVRLRAMGWKYRCGRQAWSNAWPTQRRPTYRCSWTTASL